MPASSSSVTSVSSVPIAGRLAEVGQLHHHPGAEAGDDAAAAEDPHLGRRASGRRCADARPARLGVEELAQRQRGVWISVRPPRPKLTPSDRGAHAGSRRAAGSGSRNRLSASTASWTSSSPSARVVDVLGDQRPEGLGAGRRRAERESEGAGRGPWRRRTGSWLRHRKRSAEPSAKSAGSSRSAWSHTAISRRAGLEQLEVGELAMLARRVAPRNCQSRSMRSSPGSLERLRERGVVGARARWGSGCRPRRRRRRRLPRSRAGRSGRRPRPPRAGKDEDSELERG